MSAKATKRAPGMLGVFDEVDATTRAIERLRKLDNRQIAVYTPVPRHEFEHALDTPESAVRMYTLVGGLTGTATGFALTIWTSLDWPLVTGGKPIISLPPFVIIAFELTILFGALATVLGLFITARLPRARPRVVYDPDFSEGRFGIFFAPASDAAADQAREAMRESGAAEVREHAQEVDVGTV